MADFSKLQCKICAEIAIYPLCSKELPIGRCQCGIDSFTVVERDVKCDDLAFELLNHYIIAMDFHKMTERNVEFDELWDDLNG